jgi:Xaa-Pro aminopeptidase
VKYQKRIDAARALMAEKGFDVLLISHPANRAYLSGFANDDPAASSSAAWIALTPNEGYFVTSFLYYEAVANSVRHLEPVRAQRRPLEGLIELLEKIPGSSIGFEGAWVNYSVYQKLVEVLDGEHALKPADGLIEQLRQIKDDEELKIMRQAIALTDRVYSAVVAQLRPGQTEREVAWELERALREGGADGMAFGPVVAAGAHAAVPHHEPTDHQLREGEPVWIDMGARLGGYCADLTRSFCLGSASPEYLDTYNLVLRAQEKALATIKDGVSGKEADAFARDVIEDAGRGDEFGHSLGHGVGLNIHEAPSLARTSEDTLRSGMVVTVEPGVYRAGWGGVRIEDVVLVERDGVEILSSAAKQPIVGLV